MKTPGLKFLLILFFTFISTVVMTQQRCYYYLHDFKKIADFSEAQFDSTADFYAAQFDSTAVFYSAQFDSTADFSEAQFHSITYFTNAQFDSTADFSEAQFHSTANFWDPHFHSAADFYHAQFDSTAYFVSAQFHSTADFYRAQFDSTVYFVNTQFHSTADFRFTQFNYFTDFSQATFKSDVYFDSTFLPKYLSFYEVQNISNEIDLTKANINPKYDSCYINLAYANIDKIRLRYDDFTLYWNVGTVPETKSNVYEELLRKTVQEGFINSYEKLDKEYKEFKYLEGKKYEQNRTWGKIINQLDKHWWDYGYSKELIFRNTILLFLLFFLINSIFFKEMVLNVYTIDYFGDLEKEFSGSKLNNFRKMLLFSFFYTSFIFFGFKYSYDKLKIKENIYKWRILFLVNFFLQYILGLVCLAYLANFIITK